MKGHLILPIMAAVLCMRIPPDAHAVTNYEGAGLKDALPNFSTMHAFAMRLRGIVHCGETDKLT
jgi:hypothetical protein